VKLLHGGILKSDLWNPAEIVHESLISNSIYWDACPDSIQQLIVERLKLLPSYRGGLHIAGYAVLTYIFFNTTMYSLCIVATFFPASLVGEFLLGIRLFGMSRRYVVTYSKPASSKAHAVN
jgi:hypothetical protein